jgi:hypothetical protein
VADAVLEATLHLCYAANHAIHIGIPIILQELLWLPLRALAARPNVARWYAIFVAHALDLGALPPQLAE